MISDVNNLNVCNTFTFGQMKHFPNFRELKKKRKYFSKTIGAVFPEFPKKSVFAKKIFLKKNNVNDVTN